MAEPDAHDLLPVINHPSGGRSNPISARPTRPRTSARLMYAMHHLLDRNRFWNLVAAGIESNRTLYRAFTWLEERGKHSLFGCRMCGQCALPTTAYACPESCPKQLRNGPCGGVYPDGRCEVYPERRCVWVIAYERAEAEDHVQDMRRLVRPVDHRRWGESSWVNYWRGRDDDLWTKDAALESPAVLPVEDRSPVA